MAPLYKRYIPAKSSTEKPTTPIKPVDVGATEPATTTAENKRKRERTQEEVLERKAKKLKKKGIDPETVFVERIVDQNTIKSQDASLSGAQTGVVETSQEQRLPMKKRHKLEKEARKARKAAEKGNGAGEELVGAQKIPSSVDDEHPSNESRVVANGVESVLETGKQLSHGGEDLAANETEGKAKRKKRRKEDKAYEAQEQQDPGATDGQDLELVDATTISENPSEETPKAKKRRHKLEHVLEASDTKDPNAEDDEHLRKHTLVLGKFQKSAQRAIRHQQEESFEKLAEQQVVQNLEVPPPERTPTPEFESEDAALPAWLAKPTMISGHKKATFRDLNIEAATADRLTKLGFAEALPVQQALAPVLLPPGIPGAIHPPGTDHVLPDVAVSAPTGSGKTIAYLLPMVQALRYQRQRGKLSALVVVPTRELVMQVAAVAESLVKGSSIKVGMATGTGKFKDEQEKIITRSAQYDPAGYKQLVDEAKAQIHPPDEDAEEFEFYLDQSGQEDKKRQQWIQEAVSGLVDHVPKYSSAVDILVATPGRLLEHIHNTLGFNLVHLQWLVLDEADKLLDNQNEGFLESLNAELTRSRSDEERDAREKYLRSQSFWQEHKERRLRKVVLSATMTRDISKLTSLNLRRPKMIVVRGGDSNEGQAEEGAHGESSVKESADGFELPPTLVEYCVPVGDGTEKPLVAVELLKSRIFGNSHEHDVKGLEKDNAGDKAESSDSDSDSDSEDSDSDDSSSLSSDDSDSSSSASESEESEESEDDDDSAAQQHQQSPVPDRTLLKEPTESSTQPPRAPTVLIFTSSNESAARLSHLLQNLQPSWKHQITTLVKANPGKARIRSKADEAAIAISTDRAARGLDSFNNRPITHVIQYDVPRTLTSYVHRVGRTARAGREGDAWTLYTHAEARWFVNEVAKAKNVSRRTSVEKVKLFMADDGTRERYQTVLAGMRDEVFGGAT
ncbi:hypothetical protein M409DRAFT_71599 [Zasmidium cellare ATCC 36951]|uniref:ATP-dependent RNA helicase n=1 Tax=Zasmidium cellare ATCC 36951 TaxID=1080233 RepID=A0A6A6BVH7_ZASCE|nr:uncharacterized protein M409DRAFT_71599 [Zasmidium cellare ATCC 36951]KAF2158533.1 hypothetical protein M409DRAFT_71599 [Zasmidium cellare ATCC 36951]